MRTLSGILFTPVLLVLLATPATGQADAWQRKWFWGAEMGYLYFQDDLGSNTAFNVGGHWLITGTRSALWLAYDQMVFQFGTQVTIDDGTPAGTQVGFSDGRRVQGAILVVPTDGSLQLMVGAGFSIHDILDPTIVATSLTPRNALDLAEASSTKAFALLMGSFQLRMSRSLALFANYQLMPGTEDFLIQSDQHTLMGGLRIALSSAHEEVTTQP